MAPVETKTAAALFTGLLTWMLVTYVPAFRNGLPSDLAAVLPVIVGAVGGWFAPHTPRGTDPAVFHAGMLAELKQHAEAAAEEVGMTLVKVMARDLPQAAATAAGTAAALAPMQRAAAALAGPAAEPAADPAPVPVARQIVSGG